MQEMVQETTFWHLVIWLIDSNQYMKDWYILELVNEYGKGICWILIHITLQQFVLYWSKRVETIINKIHKNTKLKKMTNQYNTPCVKFDLAGHWLYSVQTNILRHIIPEKLATVNCNLAQQARHQFYQNRRLPFPHHYYGAQVWPMLLVSLYEVDSHTMFTWFTCILAWTQHNMTTLVHGKMPLFVDIAPGPCLISWMLISAPNSTSLLSASFTHQSPTWSCAINVFKYYTNWHLDTRVSSTLLIASPYVSNLSSHEPIRTLPCRPTSL